MENVGLLLLLLLGSARTQKGPEPIFRQQGEDIEMGFCFGVDYIAVYKPGQDRDLLLGNSSDESAPSSPRVHITSRPPLLGLQISQLQDSDSGLYRRECWKDGVVDEHELQLLVCDQEASAQEITVTEDGGAELVCNGSFAAQSGASVLWYHEVFPNYTTELFLDSSVSLEPLEERLRGAVQAREGGRTLYVTAAVLKSSHHFLCLVMTGDKCLSFHNAYLPNPDELSVYRSEGERVVLACPSTHRDTTQRWETPLGQVNTTRKSQREFNKGAKMYAVEGDEPGHSLVIPALSADLFGQYSCFSPSLAGKFSLLMCPDRERNTLLFSEGGTATLPCDVDVQDDVGVLWYQHRALGNDQLVLDSRETSVALPEHLRGRAELSEQDLSLLLSQLSAEDEGRYYCVVVEGGVGFLDSDEYTDHPAEEEEEEYDEDYDPWPNSDKCFSKQVTDLSLSEGKTIEPIDDTPAPAPSSALYAAGAVGVLVLIGVVTAAVVIWKKKSAQKRTAKGQKTKDVEFEKVNTSENV